MHKINHKVVIYGEPASKANSRQMGWKKVNGKKIPFFRKSDKAISYKESAWKQCPLVLLEGDVWMCFYIFYSSRRPDLDESIILDAAQNRLYLNDRQVKERHTFWSLDKDNPRTEIFIGTYYEGYLEDVFAWIVQQKKTYGQQP